MVCPSCITCTTSSLTALAENLDSNLSEGSPPIWPGLSSHSLEACNVLSLKALRALLHFELHRLTFVEGLVTVHNDGGEVHENIFSRLALDETVACPAIVARLPPAVSQVP